MQQVRERMLRAVGCLEKAGVPYALAGGNAVAAWVSTVDDAAVRNTQDVDVMIRRADFGAARAALEAGGFVYRHAAGLDVFLDRPDASVRGGVHVVFAGEVVKAGEPAANPDVSESQRAAGGVFTVLNLDALVRIKLTAFRDKDRTHLRDLIGVGLVGRDWLGSLPPVLSERLREILDNPEG